MDVTTWVEKAGKTVQRRFYKRVIIFAGALVLSIGAIAVLLRIDTINNIRTLPQFENGMGRYENASVLDTCTSLGRTWDPAKMKNSESKYEDLLDDKFT